MSQVFEVRFECIAQTATQGRFSVPKSVVEILGLDDSSEIIIETTSASGVNSVVTTLKSGNEIYGGLDNAFEAGEHIYVRVTRIGATN